MLSASASAHKTLLSLTKSDVGLSNVDNTADTAKPVSTAQQTAINTKIGGSVGATDNRLVRSDGTGSLTLQSTGITVDDTNRVSGAECVRANEFGGNTSTLNVGESNATTLIYFVTSSSAKWRVDQTAGSNVGSLNPSGTRHIGDLTPVQSITAVTFIATGLIGLGTYTVATLPSASANSGRIAQVTDSSVTTNGSAVAGGGANRVMVFSNGSTWDVVVA